MTGFDRFDEASGELDLYNVMIMWRCSSPEQARIVGGARPSDAGGPIAIRQALRAALRTDYFKVEGLAAIPSAESGRDGTLLVGVRERGEHKERFDYVSEIVAAGSRIAGGELSFIGDFELIYRFVARQCGPDLRHECGLSGLEYDPSLNACFC